VNIVCRSFDPKSPVCEYDRLENCLLVNTYHIIRGCRDEILEAIRDFRPKLIWTHSSPLGILAEHVVSKGLPPFDVPIVATYAEKIYPHIRNILQQAFPARYIEYFANRENSFASWGESDDKFYEVSEYCHLEVDRRWGDGVTGDLITTGLHNYAVPLIRYDPGDIVKWHGFTNPEVPYPVIELLGGRGKDILVSRDGLTVPYFLAYIDSKKFNKLIKYQIEQLNIDEVILRVVPRQNFDRERDENGTKRCFCTMLQNRLLINFASASSTSTTSLSQRVVSIAPSFRNWRSSTSINLEGHDRKANAPLVGFVITSSILCNKEKGRSL